LGVSRGNLLVDTLVLLANLLDVLSARARDGGGVTVVGVDASEIRLDTVGTESGDDDLARSTVTGAVTARSVELANVDDSVAVFC
jgi:hypothetical protein